MPGKYIPDMKNNTGYRYFYKVFNHMSSLIDFTGSTYLLKVRHVCTFQFSTDVSGYMSSDFDRVLSIYTSREYGSEGDIGT